MASPSILTGKGDYRRVRFISKRLGESLDTVYWVEGEYIPEAMAEISNIMRDWRLDLVKPIDRRLVDVVSASHKLLETSEPVEVISGYRSPQTNAMLRRRSRGVARNSYHMQGMAVDTKVAGRTVAQVFAAATACQGGGVGRYSRSSFVHMDCGPVRTWGR